MKAVALLLVSLVSLSACMGAPAGPEDRDAARLRTAAGTTPEGGQAGAFKFDLGALSYRNELLTYRLTAAAPALVTVEIEGFLSRFADRADCAIAYAFTPRSTAFTDSFGLAREDLLDQIKHTAGGGAWSVMRDLTGTRLRAGPVDQQVSANAYPSPASVGAVIEQRMNWTLEPGQELIVHVGGSDSAYAKYQYRDARPIFNGRVQNGLRMWVNATQDLAMEQLPSRALRCGTHFEPATGGAHAGNYVGGASVSASVLLETQTASTLLLVGPEFPLGVDGEGRAHFGGKTMPVTPESTYRLSTTHTGKLGFEIDRWVHAGPAEGRWLIADAWLPAFEVYEAE